LEEIKRDPELRSIPILMTSGMDMKQECLDAGADAFIMKPFRPAQLLDQMQAMIEASQNN